jgi:hypothetical protein
MILGAYSQRILWDSCRGNKMIKFYYCKEEDMEQLKTVKLLKTEVNIKQNEVDLAIKNIILLSISLEI